MSDADDLLLDAGPFVPSRQQIIDHLLSIICPAGEPWTGDDPTSDHGHTHCMFVGAAIRALRTESGVGVEP